MEKLTWHPSCFIMNPSAWCVPVYYSKLKNLWRSRCRLSELLNIAVGKRCWGLDEKPGVLWSSACLIHGLADFNNWLISKPISVVIYHHTNVGCGVHDVWMARSPGHPIWDGWGISFAGCVSRRAYQCVWFRYSLCKRCILCLALIVYRIAATFEV